MQETSLNNITKHTFSFENPTQKNVRIVEKHKKLWSFTGIVKIDKDKTIRKLNLNSEESMKHCENDSKCLKSYFVILISF